jgi:glucose dehydrogenase
LDLIYYGTANPGPWNADGRPGDNKWTCGVFARRPDSGEAIWFYQWSPHDLFDHDGINENILIDLQIQGKSRKVILHPGHNGYMYVLDPATGEVLSADAYVRITAFKEVVTETRTVKAMMNVRVIDLSLSLSAYPGKTPRGRRGRAGYVYSLQALCMRLGALRAQN